MVITHVSGDVCAAQIDWMLPYISMVLAVILSCTLATLYHIVTGPSIIWGGTLRLWIKIIIESSLLFTVAPITYYTMSDIHTSCPLLGVTMITVS